MIESDSTARTVFSTDVRLTVEFDGQALPLSAVGPDTFVLQTPRVLREGNATLVVSVNGEPRRSAIVIAETPTAVRRVAYSRTLDASAPSVERVA